MEVVNPEVSAVPYVQRRIVQWGDCDPAGIIYTPRFLDYAIEAVDGWQRQVTGHDWISLNANLSLGRPSVHVEMDFAIPLKPGDELDVEVLVEALGNSSITFAITGAITGRLAPGRAAFTCTLVTVQVTREPYRATPVPDDLRARIEAYMAACEAAAGD